METILIILILYIIFLIPTQIGWGLIFKKKGLGFTKGVIPFYNKIILINYYKLKPYHLILIFIPLLSVYSNYCIYKSLCNEYNKEFLYVIQLTYFPFVYNFFIAFEIKQQQPVEKIDNYFEDQKNIFESKEEKTTTFKDDYVWKPKKIVKSNDVYKATRNNLSAKVNINIERNNNIIDNKKVKIKENENTKECPNCGVKVNIKATHCHVCGTKL